MTTIMAGRKSAANGDAVHSLCPGYQTRSLFFSDGETIKLSTKAHKPADSVLVVGKGTRRCSFQDVTPKRIKRFPVNMFIGIEARYDPFRFQFGLTRRQRMARPLIRPPAGGRLMLTPDQSPQTRPCPPPETRRSGAATTAHTRRSSPAVRCGCLVR